MTDKLSEALKRIRQESEAFVGVYTARMDCWVAQIKCYAGIVDYMASRDELDNLKSQARPVDLYAVKIENLTKE